MSANNTYRATNAQGRAIRTTPPRRGTTSCALEPATHSHTAKRRTMRTITLNLLAIPLLVACTADGAETSSSAVVEQEQAQTQQPKASLETVYAEPADRPPNDVPPKTVDEESARAMRAERVEAAIALDIDYVAQGAPEGTDALARRLRSREIEMIPSAHELKTDEHAAQKLLFIEDNAALLIERQRALALLRHFYTDEVRARLIERAQDASIATAIRATALRGLLAASDPDDAEVQQILEQARGDKSVRIRKAARP